APAGAGPPRPGVAKRGVRRPKAPIRPSGRTMHRRLAAQQGHADALLSWRELRDAIRAEGGIRPNGDFGASQIPTKLRAQPGHGTAPDWMAQVWTSYGHHFEGAHDKV